MKDCGSWVCRGVGYHLPGCEMRTRADEVEGQSRIRKIPQKKVFDMLSDAAGRAVDSVEVYPDGTIDFANPDLIASAIISEYIAEQEKDKEP